MSAKNKSGIAVSHAFYSAFLLYTLLVCLLHVIKVHKDDGVTERLPESN